MARSRTLALLLALLLVPHPVQFSLASNTPTPLPPNTAFEDTVPIEAMVEEIAAAVPSDRPTRIRIPSIKLDASIEDMGINEKGEMDVPDGSSKNVGWYKYGTVPGNAGSAVMDAHVYAAFKKLKHVRENHDIFVTLASGKEMHFKVIGAGTYTLSQIPMDFIFQSNDRPRLNLITCAGKFSKALNTYTHRLVVYAILVE